LPFRWKYVSWAADDDLISAPAANAHASAAVRAAALMERRCGVLISQNVLPFVGFAWMTSFYLRPLDFVSRFSAKRLLKRASHTAQTRELVGGTQPRPPGAATGRTAVRRAPGGANGFGASNEDRFVG
jgi:hypothetical protein